VSIERVAAIVSIISGAVFGGVLFLFALTDNWDKVEAAARAIYPLPLLLLVVGALVVMAGLYQRERRRKRPVTYREASIESGERRDQKKAAARRTVTLIMNEVASNRRLVLNASTHDPPPRFTLRENWVAHRHALAELEDAGKAYAATQAAYDQFDNIDDLLSHDSIRNPTNNELHAAQLAAERAEATRKQFLDFIEGPHTRWAASGVGRQDT